MSRRPFTHIVYPQPPGLSTENGFAEVFCTNTYNKSSLNPLLWRGLKHGNKRKRTLRASPMGANGPGPADRVQRKLAENRHGGSGSARYCGEGTNYGGRGLFFGQQAVCSGKLHRDRKGCDHLQRPFRLEDQPGGGDGGGALHHLAGCPHLEYGVCSQRGFEL